MMKKFLHVCPADAGMTLVELMIVLLGAGIIAVAAVPALNTSLDQYNLVSGAEGITTQLQYARLRAITSNETLRVNFPEGTNTYQVELSDGTILRGPFYYPNGILPNTKDEGAPVSFPGRYVTFLPNGTVPTAGDGSKGRVKLINQSEVRIDIIVGSGGVIRETPSYRQSSAPF